MIDFFRKISGPAALIVAIAAFLSIYNQPVKSQFGAQALWAGSGSGTANAQTMSIPNVSQLSDVIGVPISFLPGVTNTGPTTVTLNSLSATTVFRPTPLGAVALGGGELVSSPVSHVATIVYDGTRFQLTISANPALPGAMMNYAGTSCPTGWLAMNGGTQPQASYPTLNTIVGATWGSNAGGNFTLPDFRGRTAFGVDNGQNRITVAGGNIDGTVIGNYGGQQNQTLTTAQIPSHTHNITTGTDNTPHTHVSTASGLIAGTSSSSATSPGGLTVPAGTTNLNTTNTGNPNSSHTHSGTTDGGTGGGGSHPVLSNAAITVKCVRT